MIDLKIVTIPPILRTQRYVVTKIVINDKGSPTKPPTSVVTGKLHDCWKFTPDALVTIEEAIAFANEKGYDFVGYNLAGGSVLCVDPRQLFSAGWRAEVVGAGVCRYLERLRLLCRTITRRRTHHGLHLWIRVDQKDPTGFAERMAGAGKKKVVKNVGADHEKIELFSSNYVTMMEMCGVSLMARCSTKKASKNFMRQSTERIRLLLR